MAQNVSEVREVNFSELIKRLPERLDFQGDSTPVPDFAGEKVTVGSRELHVRRTKIEPATKRDAVFVHGLGGSSTNWTDLMYLLEPVINGWAPDLPGFGQSPKPADRDYTISTQSEMLINFIEDQCEGPVDLFGNSMGGAIAIRIAGLRPDLVRSLILISPAVPNLRPRKEMVEVGLATMPGVATLYEHVAGTPNSAKAVDRLHKIVFQHPEQVHPERRSREISESELRMSVDRPNDPLVYSARALMRTYLPRVPDNTWNFARKVEAPTLAIFGSDDLLVDPRMAIPTSRNFKNSTVVTLHTAHVAQLEVPVDVATLVLNHWSD